MKYGSHPPPDYYAILGVSPTASADEIKSAFRNLVKTFHPDRFQSYADKNKNGKKVKEVIEAYQVLRNTRSREEYDKRLIVIKTASQENATKRKASSVRVKSTFDDSFNHWTFWVGGIGTAGLTGYLLFSTFPTDWSTHPFKAAVKFLMLAPGLAFVSFMAVAMVIFFSLLIIQGFRVGLETGADLIADDRPRLKKKFLLRSLVVFCVSMTFAQSYFEWNNPLLIIFAGIGTLILGYGFIFVPVLFGEFFALLYYYTFTRHTVARATALATQIDI